VKKILITIAVLVMLSSCGVPYFWDSTQLDEDWTLMTVLGIDYSATQRVYTLSEGSGTCTQAGVPLGNGFTFTYTETEVTLIGTSEEGLVANTYSYTLAGDTLTLYFNSVEYYVFEK